MQEFNDRHIEIAARTAHNVNRHYCSWRGDHSQTDWDDAPEWQKTSALNGVRGVLAGNTPKQSHEGWLREKRKAGWKYGAVKDPKKKTHPCMVPYEKLPPEQQYKDILFVKVVRGILGI